MQANETDKRPENVRAVGGLNMTVKEWDERNSNKPVYKWEPFPDGMDYIKYPNGLVVISIETLKQLLEDYKNMEVNA